MKQLLLLFALVLMACSCGSEQGSGNPALTHDDADSISLRINTVHDSLHIIYLNVHDELRDSLVIQHPIYRFETGDLTGDGLPEVVVGVVKPTRYWATPDRRLFIYHLFAGHYIRPLWLGSRVGSPLLDFALCRDSVPCRIITREQPADSHPINAQYRLHGFGLQFEKYLTTFAQ